MKKLLGLVIFLAAAAASAQTTPIWTSWADSWIRWDGGNPITTGGLPATPVLGDMIYFDGSNWASLPYDIDGECVIGASGIPAWGSCSGSAVAFGDIGTGSNTTATMTCGTGCSIATSGSGSITATAAVSSIALTTPSITSPNLITPTTSNGSTGPGQLTFLEDTDNGSNTITVIAPSAITADVVQTLPDKAGTFAMTSDVPGSPITSISVFDDFLCGTSGGGTTSNIGSCLGNTGSGSGGATSQETSTDANRPGIGGINTSTSASAVESINSAGNSILLISGTEDLKFAATLQALSTTAETYTALAGMCDGSATSGTTCTDGAWFSYSNDDGNATPNWMINTNDNTGPTTASCGVPPVAGTFQTFEIAVNSDATAVNFYIDGSECSNSPISTHIPTAAGRQTRPYQFKIVKSNGTTARGFYFDWMWFTKTVSR